MNTKAIGNSRNAMQVILSVLFIALFAQIEIDLPLNKANISISGQTFAVLLAAIHLGRWRALLAVLVYLLLGAMGLPVFAGGGAGMEKFWGPSAGYFAGFMIGAYLVGALGESGWNKDFWTSLWAMTIGTLVILLLGTTRLFFLFEDWTMAIENGFLPFLAGGAVKIVIGATASVLIYRLFVKWNEGQK